MNRITKSIPNFITCLNLFSGCLGIIAALENNLIAAFALMIISAVMDFFDGFSARLLKAYSPIGKELDSLADVVSFGVLPGIIAFQIGGGEIFGLVIPCLSALRLAKFNIDTRQSEQFIGLPTPANAIFFGAIGYLSQSAPNLAVVEFLVNPYTQYALISAMSLLLVCELPMFSLKFKSYAFSKNRVVYTFILLTVVSLLIFKVLAIPFVIVGYVIYSVISRVSVNK